MKIRTVPKNNFSLGLPLVCMWGENDFLRCVFSHLFKIWVNSAILGSHLYGDNIVWETMVVHYGKLYMVNRFRWQDFSSF